VGSAGAAVIGTATGPDTGALKVVGSQSVTIESLKIEAPVSSELGILMKRCLNCSVSRTEVTRDADGTGHEGGIGVKDSGYASISRVTLKRAGLLVERSRAEVRGSLLEGPAQTWGGVMAVEGDVAMDSTTIRGYGGGVVAFLGSTVNLGGLFPPSSGDRTIRLEDNNCGVCASESSHVRVGVDADWGAQVLISSAPEPRAWADVHSSKGAYVGLEGNVSISGSAWGAAEARMNGTVALGAATIDKNDYWYISADRRGFIDFGPVTFKSGLPDVRCDPASTVTGKVNLPEGTSIACPNLY
jgi:hypothetical protein